MQIHKDEAVMEPGGLSDRVRELSAEKQKQAYWREKGPIGKRISTFA